MAFYETLMQSMLGTGFAALISAFIVLYVLVIIALYVYFALVLMTVARKLKHKEIAWLAWIPVANFFLLPILAKKHWAWGFILLVPIVNIVFAIIWTWNIFEQRKYPGWLSLIVLVSFIPVIGLLGSIGHLVIWGLVAWKNL